MHAGISNLEKKVSITGYVKHNTCPDSFFYETM